MSVKKHDLEVALRAEKQEINAGRLREDNPLDDSQGFKDLCLACRRGDLKVCQEKIAEGVNVNGRDRFDYTPLNLSSLCGHYEVVRLLLESGALCERDTFEGERCLYNALNDRIRNLLLSYDYSKSRDPLQPLAGHITSLLYRDIPQTSDITIVTEQRELHLHKFILAARSPYFAKKLAAAPETTSWRVPGAVPVRSLEVAIQALYMNEISLDIDEEEEVLKGLDNLCHKLEIGDILQMILETDRRLARQYRTKEIERARDQLETWFGKMILGNTVQVDISKADNVKWDRQNSIFADVLLCADDPDADEAELEELNDKDQSTTSDSSTPLSFTGIPLAQTSPEATTARRRKQVTLFPAHRAMLIRSEFFLAMFSSAFREAQLSDHLPVIHLDCSPAVLRVILSYMYTEQSNFGLDVALPVLFTSDAWFIEKLKVKAAMIISTLGNGSASIVESENPRGETDVEDIIDIYDVVRAGWDTRVHRLEEFGARYIAYRLERYIDEPEFKELVRESAARIKERQETDTVEIVDDIRYYLSDRFRLRFEDVGFDELAEEQHYSNEGNGQVASVDVFKGDLDLNADVDHPQYSNKRVDEQRKAMEHESSTKAIESQQFSIKTLDGQVAGDEFAQDALNYQILLGKIDTLLDELKLDA